MSGRGVFAVDRGIWDDTDFASERFSEREAFLWLVGQAAWRPTTVRISGRQIALARGELAASTRFMAEKWDWSEARVRRFLGRMVAAGIVSTKADKSATHISILKYDRFQKVSLPTEGGPTHHRRTSDAAPSQERRTLSDEEIGLERRTSDAPPFESRRKEEDRNQLGCAGASAPRKPRSPADPSWPLTDELIGEAERCGIERLQAIQEWPRFLDYSLREDARHCDWIAAWRGWCRSPYRRFDAAASAPRITGTEDRRGSPPPREKPRGLAGRLVRLHAELQQAGSGAEQSLSTLDQSAAESNQGEDQGITWMSGGGAGPSEALVRAAGFGGHDSAASRRLRSSRITGSKVASSPNRSSRAPEFETVHVARSYVNPDLGGLNMLDRMGASDQPKPQRARGGSP